MINVSRNWKIVWLLTEAEAVASPLFIQISYTFHSFWLVLKIFLLFLYTVRRRVYSMWWASLIRISILVSTLNFLHNQPIFAWIVNLFIVWVLYWFCIKKYGSKIFRILSLLCLQFTIFQKYFSSKFKIAFFTFKRWWKSQLLILEGT